MVSEKPAYGTAVCRIKDGYMKRITGLILFPFCFFVFLFLGGCASGSQEAEMDSSEIRKAAEELLQTEEMPINREEGFAKDITWLSDSEEQLGTEQRILIEDYRRRYYESLTDFRTREIGDLFSQDAKGWISLHENTWEYLAGLRKMQQSDLRLSGYRSEMTLDQIVKEEDGLRVIITEKSTQNFAQHPDIDSELYGIIHTFKLVREDGRWLIREHQQRDGIYWNMQREYWGDEIEALEDPEAYFSERKDIFYRPRKRN